MKKTYIKLICTAALLAALPIAGCTNMDKGKRTTQNDDTVILQTADETCPDGDCEDDGCPDCPENGDSGKDDCPDGKCPEKHGKRKRRRGHAVIPKESFRKHRKPHHPPKLPVDPPKDDDIVLPNPPVDDELPKN